METKVFSDRSTPLTTMKNNLPVVFNEVFKIDPGPLISDNLGIS